MTVDYKIPKSVWRNICTAPYAYIKIASQNIFYKDWLHTLLATYILATHKVSNIKYKLHIRLATSKISYTKYKLHTRLATHKIATHIY